MTGNDPKQWQTKVPSYGSVAYHGVYPGIDVVYDARRGGLEYDFEVAPGAEPRAGITTVYTALAPSDVLI